MSLRAGVNESDIRSPQRIAGHRQAREQRKQLDEIAAELVASWWDRADDPFMVEVLRGMALAQSIDDAHR
jgi:hypothetical protein